MNKTKQVTLRLPNHVIKSVKKIAKMAGVTPSQAYNVILAWYIVFEEKNNNKKK